MIEDSPIYLGFEKLIELGILKNIYISGNNKVLIADYFVLNQVDYLIHYFKDSSKEVVTYQKRIRSYGHGISGRYKISKDQWFDGLRKDIKKKIVFHLDLLA